MAYIDGLVAAVPHANKELYREHATRMAEAMKHAVLAGRMAAAQRRDVPVAAEG